MIKVSRILVSNQVDLENKLTSEYPKAGAQVDGLQVGASVPNTGSISASMNTWETLPGIREVSLAEWYADPKDYYRSASDVHRCEVLAEKIRESGWIAPLIVVVQDGEPYILEGGHRLCALWLLGKKAFPALVVIDTD